MNPKERITVALQGGTPDRVPVTLGLSAMVPVRFFTGNYIDFFWKETIPLWKARVETEFDRFGADSFIHLSENPSPHDPPTELRDVKESDERVTYTNVIHTRKGDLKGEFFIGPNSPVSIISPYVKSAQADYEKVLETL